MFAANAAERRMIEDTQGQNRTEREVLSIAIMIRPYRIYCVAFRPV
jgi:hypothetical protein